MKKTAIVLALTTLISAYSQRSYGADFEGLLSGSQVPLTVQLKDLDSSWRQFVISGQFEIGDILKIYTELFQSGNSTSSIYYTQGQTVTIDSETYVIAYRLSPQGKGLNFRSLIEKTLGNGCDESSIANQLTSETNLTLSLLNLRTIGSLNDIRTFNLKEELAASQQAYQEAKAACEKKQLELINSQVKSDLIGLSSALISYTSEFDVFPQMDNPEIVKADLEGWVQDSSVFLHPETAEPYQPNPTLSGKNIVDIPNPEEIVVFYEASPAQDGTRGVLFVNGVVDRIAAADWSKVKKDSKLP